MDVKEKHILITLVEQTKTNNHTELETTTSFLRSFQIHYHFPNRTQVQVLQAQKLKSIICLILTSCRRN